MEIGESPFSEADYVDTGKIADKVIDVNRPGEWCLVDPNGRVFCNPLRQATTVPFGNLRDAAMLTLSAEALASATFQWLLGTELAANMVEVTDGFFRVGVPRLHIYVSMASNEDELVTHVLAMENKPGVKVVIITARHVQPSSIMKANSFFTFLSIALAFLTPLSFSSCGPSAKAAGKAFQKGGKYADYIYRISNSDDY